MNMDVLGEFEYRIKRLSIRSRKLYNVIFFSFTVAYPPTAPFEPLPPPPRLIQKTLRTL